MTSLRSMTAWSVIERAARGHSVIPSFRHRDIQSSPDVSPSSISRLWKTLNTSRYSASVAVM